MPTINQLIRIGRESKKDKSDGPRSRVARRSVSLYSCLYTTPKSHSALRKVARVRLQTV